MTVMDAFRLPRRRTRGSHAQELEGGPVRDDPAGGKLRGDPSSGRAVLVTTEPALERPRAARPKNLHCRCASVFTVVEPIGVAPSPWPEPSHAWLGKRTRSRFPPRSGRLFRVPWIVVDPSDEDAARQNRVIAPAPATFGGHAFVIEVDSQARVRVDAVRREAMV